MRILCALLLSCNLSLASNILFINTWHSKSHGRTMMYLAERLVAKGHNVSMYSQVQKPLGQMGEGVHTLESVRDGKSDDQSVVDKLFWFGEMRPQIFEEPHKIGYQYFSQLRNDETFLNVMNTPFDLVVVDEMFSVAQAAMAFKLKQKFGSKITVFSTTDLFALFSMYRGLGRNPVSYPNYYTKGYSMFDYDPRHFPTRFLTVIDILIEQYVTRHLSNGWVKQAGRDFGMDISMERLYEESVLTFIDYPSRYGMTTPRANDLIFVGEHCQPSFDLPTSLRSFVDDPASKGTIYIAFGSIVNWMAGPPKVVETFVEVLNSLSDYRVIWSYAGAKLTSTLPHVMMTPWAPQNDILAHPKTVLFFTHGGLKSLKEGICSSTPLLFLPFFADQPKNALYAMNMGIAEAIYKRNITYEEMSTKIERALHSSSMQANIAKLRSHFLDNVVESLDLGVYWAERAIKLQRESRPYYTIRGRQLWWHQFLYFELFALSLIVVSAVSL